MTTAALFTPGRPHQAHATLSVGAALRELATAARHLTSAVWAAATQVTQATQTTAVEARTLTATEQAERVRAMADVQMRFDLRFAQELYAMANRHEAAARRA